MNYINTILQVFPESFLTFSKSFKTIKYIKTNNYTTKNNSKR